MTGQPEIHFERRGQAGLVTLDRPKALNALSHAMVRELAAQLRLWQDDPAVRVVVVRGNGRAFSAGGDIRAVYEEGRNGPPAVEFFRDEYRLNAVVKHFSKPYVALVDGYVMGGGAGISVHGSHRVFGEKAIFAMPETAIGFFPDIGASYVLSRMPSQIGLYCGLGAIRLAQGDCLYAGVATHTAPAASFDAITEELAAGEDVDAVLGRAAVAATPETLPAIAPLIAAIFATGNAEAILGRLAAVAGEQAEWARATVEAIRAKSPTSVTIALRQIRAAAMLDFDDCIRLDWRIVNEILAGHDFYEGVRAVLVDKDNAPRWQPASLGTVDPSVVERHFVPPAEGDLTLP